MVSLILYYRRGCYWRLSAEILTLGKDDTLFRIDGVRGRISSLVFLADGKHLVCACKAERTIQIWNIEDHGEGELLVNTGVAVNDIASSTKMRGGRTPRKDDNSPSGVSSERCDESHTPVIPTHHKSLNRHLSNPSHFIVGHLGRRLPRA